MDINATDIAALQKILQQAEEWMIAKGEDPNAPKPEGGEQPPMPEEAGEGEGEPAVEVEIEAAPKPKPGREVLDVIDFGGMRADPNENKPPKTNRAPVGRKARY